MYENIMHKLDFKGFKSAKYQDPESRRIAGTTAKFMNNLTRELIKSGNLAQAKQVMTKSVRELPEKIYSIEDTVNRIYTVNNLYAVKDVKMANEIATNTATFLEAELSYISSLDSGRQRSYERDFQLGMQVLQNLEKMADDNRQLALGTHLRKVLHNIQQQFV